MAKRGRPATNNPRIVNCRVRMTKEEAERLEDLRRATGMNTSDTVRTAMEYMHDSIMKGYKNESETEIEKSKNGT